MPRLRPRPRRRYRPSRSSNQSPLLSSQAPVGISSPGRRLIRWGAHWKIQAQAQGWASAEFRGFPDPVPILDTRGAHGLRSGAEARLTSTVLNRRGMASRAEFAGPTWRFERSASAGQSGATRPLPDRLQAFGWGPAPRNRSREKFTSKACSLAPACPRLGICEKELARHTLLRGRCVAPDHNRTRPPHGGRHSELAETPDRARLFT